MADQPMDDVALLRKLRDEEPEYSLRRNDARNAADRIDYWKARAERAEADAEQLAETIDAAAAIGHGISLAGWWANDAVVALERHNAVLQREGQ